MRREEDSNTETRAKYFLKILVSLGLPVSPFQNFRTHTLSNCTGEQFGEKQKIPLR